MDQKYLVSTIAVVDYTKHSDNDDVVGFNATQYMFVASVNDIASP